MKIKLLFMALCFCSFSYLSYGQTQTLPEPAPVAISSNPTLNAQRVKLDSKQAEISRATSTSRVQVSKLNDEFAALKEAYVRSLSIELEKAADASTRTQLQEEIKRYSAANPQTR